MWVGDRTQQGQPFASPARITFRSIPSASTRSSPMPEIGDIAPDFTLKETFDTSVTLSDYRGKIVVLDFWGDW